LCGASRGQAQHNPQVFRQRLETACPQPADRRSPTAANRLASSAKERRSSRCSATR
jgi:hypothetical protein